MNYHSQFCSPDELNSLISSVQHHYDPGSNRIDLPDIDALKAKITDYIFTTQGVEVEFLGAFMFLACSTTMERMKLHGGWHTDSTCTVIDGDCFNAWIPLYVDSLDTGLEVIGEAENPDFYEQLGDPTQPLEIVSRNGSPHIFKMLDIPQSKDMVAINTLSGTVVPFHVEELNVSHFAAPKAGDLCLFRQSEVHRGFHQDGVRIQLSLKFFDKAAQLNKKQSNSHYKLLHNNLGLDSIPSFINVLNQITPVKPLSKHGKLEGEMLKALFRTQLSAA